MRVVAFALLLAVAMPVRAEESRWTWTREELAYEAMFVGIVFVDWRQTIWALDHGNGGTEQNPFLGARPSRVRLNTMALGGVAGHALVTRLIPRPYRPYWQMFSIGFESATVGWNFRRGASVSMRF
jgi:hypothetical protein